MFEGEQTHTRQELVRKLFFYAADDDYICARLCGKNALYRHFSWNAAQCIEKYTKCILLLNGGKAKFSHDFINKFETELVEANASLFPKLLDISKFTKIKDGFEKFTVEPVLDFVKRIEASGQPSVRYNTTNNVVQPYDLQKLDRIVFLLRRLCVPSPVEEVSHKQHWQRLVQDLNYTTAVHWPTVQYEIGGYLSKREALEFENCANFPELLEQSKGSFFMAMHIAPNDAMAAVGLVSQSDQEWLEKNVKL